MKLNFEDLAQRARVTKGTRLEKMLRLLHANWNRWGPSAFLGSECGCRCVSSYIGILRKRGLTVVNRMEPALNNDRTNVCQNSAYKLTGFSADPEPQ